VGEQRSTDAAAEVVRGRAHRLDLAVVRFDLSQRPAAGQVVAVPERPHRDVRTLQAGQVEEVAGVLRRVGEHAFGVQSEELPDLGPFEIVHDDPALRRR
jgi:hypothetical protein